MWRRLTQSEARLTQSEEKPLFYVRIWEQKDRVSRAGLVACERNGSLDIYQQEITRLHALLEEAGRAEVPHYAVPEPPGDEGGVD